MYGTPSLNIGIRTIYFVISRHNKGIDIYNIQAKVPIISIESTGTYGRLASPSIHEECWKTYGKQYTTQLVLILYKRNLNI